MPEGSGVGGCDGVIDWLAGPLVEGLAPAAMAVAMMATPMVVANIPCLMGKVYRSSRYVKQEASVR
jgi:hypothetical protein